MQGTVRKLNSWKTGKGFFFLLNEVEGEWFGYGMPSFKVGDHVQFEPMSRKLNKATQVRFGKAKAIVPERDLHDVEEFFDASEVKPIGKPDKDAVITRLACLKAASQIAKTPDEAITIAERFVKWAKE